MLRGYFLRSTFITSTTSINSVQAYQDFQPFPTSPPHAPFVPRPSSLLSPCFLSCDSDRLRAAYCCCDCSGLDVLPAALSRTPTTLPLTSSPETVLSPRKAASLLSGALHRCLYSLSSRDDTCINSLKSSTAAYYTTGLFHPLLSPYSTPQRHEILSVNRPHTPLYKGFLLSIVDAFTALYIHNQTNCLLIPFSLSNKF